MSLANTSTRYGLVARVLHWLTAALILTAIPLGLIAHELPFQTDAELAWKAQVMSLHKTCGVSAFFVALMRVLWAVTQTRPVPVDPDQRRANTLAAWVHGALYAGILIVPVTGWLHHAATTGFAPILWPFGQTLPFIPQSPALADVFATSHWLFTKVLGLLVVLHIAGAVKHALVSKDGTLARMVRGRDAGEPGTPHPRGRHAATALWLVAILGAALLSWNGRSTEVREIAAPIKTGWTVESGQLEIEIRQLGQPVTGSFSDWTAQITFDPDQPGPEKGAVAVTVQVASLTLGTVTNEALNPDFLDAGGFPTATFNATIIEESETYRADGMLSLRGTEIPATLPFTLTEEGDVTRAVGTLTLDRRDFAIGGTYADETSLGFSVVVRVTLTARPPQ